jgi:hypothetical protein
MKSRQECVEAPVPCSSSATGPCPITCTCQRIPAAATNRLASRCGQSAPSVRQSSRSVMGAQGTSRTSNGDSPSKKPAPTFRCDASGSSAVAPARAAAPYQRASNSQASSPAASQRTSTTRMRRVTSRVSKRSKVAA